MPNSVDFVTLSDDLPVFLQSGIGAGYSAIDARRALAIGVQEGVESSGDFKVGQRAAGAGMAVDVAAGRGLVKGDTVADEGLYYVRRAAALTGATEITADAAEANPRIDQVILEIKNDVHDGSGLNRGRVRYLKGTATAGTTLDTRVGAAALPNTAIRLADVLMPAGAVNVPTANIRDRRPWARGSHAREVDATATIFALTTSFAAMAANLTVRLECSGVPLVATLIAHYEHSVAGGAIKVRLEEDGVLAPTTAAFYRARAALAGGDATHAGEWRYTPSVGSHAFRATFAEDAADGTVRRDLVAPIFDVSEDLRPGASNT